MHHVKSIQKLLTFDLFSLPEHNVLLVSFVTSLRPLYVFGLKNGPGLGVTILH